ncbi:MAG: metallophosphoesterase [Pseudomonadota bacterium]
MPVGSTGLANGGSGSIRLWAISDLHITHQANRAALDDMPVHADDWLILAGDVGDRPEHLEHALRVLTPRFRQIVWVPGNHDLWTLLNGKDGLRGVPHY